MFQQYYNPREIFESIGPCCALEDEKFIFIYFLKLSLIRLGDLLF